MGYEPKKEGGSKWVPFQIIVLPSQKKSKVGREGTFVSFFLGRPMCV
jgi:hypothetical protein